MPKLIIIRGAICAGKTTTVCLLRESLPDYALIEPDVFKQMADKTKSSIWRKIIAEKTALFFLTELMKRGRGIIITLHGHDLKMYRLIKKLAFVYRYQATSFLLVVPLKTCLIRNNNRGVPGMNYRIPKSKLINFLKNTKTIKGERVFDTSLQSTKEVVQNILVLGELSGKDSK